MTVMLSRKPASVACMALLVAVMTPAAAIAQTSDTERTALARSLFEEALGLGDAGEWEEAVDRYRRVLSLRRSPTVLFNLAHALSEAGELVEAGELLQQVVRDESSPDDLRAQAEELRNRLLPRIGRLTIELTGDPGDVAVTLDGGAVEAAILGVGFPIDPGAHAVLALRDGETVASGEIEIAEGEAGTVTLEIPARAIPAPEEIAMPVDPVPEGPDLTLTISESGSEEAYETWWFWTIIGALLAGGVVTGALFATGAVGGGQPFVECNFGGMSCRMELP